MTHSQNSVQERLIALRDRTYELCREATDSDEAENWSHYNGAANALLFCVEAGVPVPESLVDSYWQVVGDSDIDNDENEEA